MNRQDIASELCSRIPGMQRAMAYHVVDTFPEILADSFERGEDVFLRGFGTLTVKTAKAKPARDINAGTPMVIPSHRTVRFRPSKTLKNRLNK